MKKILIAGAAVAALGFATNASAQSADDWSYEAGALGLGFDSVVPTTLSAGSPMGVARPALSVRYFANEAFGLELMLGYSSMSRSFDGDPAAKYSVFDLSLLGEYRIASSGRATLSAFGGFGLAMESVGVLAADGDLDSEGVTHIGIEVGLRAEVWLYDYFSLFVRGGLTFDPYSAGESDFDTGDDQFAGSDLGFGRGGLLGSAGVTFWFQ